MTEHTLQFTDYALTRRYFTKVRIILRTLMRIANQGAPGAEAADHENVIVSDHLGRLANSIEALSAKHILTGRIEHRLPAAFEIDRTDSGFPAFREFIQLQNDREMVDEVLFDLPDRGRLKREMVDHVLKFRTLPRDLQFALSQRLYFEILKKGDLFLTRNTPALQYVAERPPHGHRRYIVDWAVYDTTRNLPDIYVMVLDDSAKRPLHEDEDYSNELAEAMLNQSISTLKLVTIAQGLDTDFETVHPKSLKRIHVGPLYSNTFTHHSSDIQNLLDDYRETPGSDWVFAWTVESLASKGIEYVRTGIFGQVQKEIYKVDHTAMDSFEAGSTSVEQYMILPLEAYQTLAESEQRKFDGIHKFVVGADGQVVAHS